VSAVPSQGIGVHETLSDSNGDDRIDENRNRPARRSGSSATRTSWVFGWNRQRSSL